MTAQSAMPEVRRKVVSVPLSYVIALVPVAAVLNIIGANVVQALKLPVFLDIIGTVVVAIVLGPWWAALTGLITNLAIGFTTNPIYIPYASINVLVGLIMGYGVRWGLAKDNVRYLVLTLIQAVLTAAASAPITTFVFGGATGHFSDIMTTAFAGMGQTLVGAVFSSEMIVTVADRVLSGYMALAIVAALPRNLSRGVQLPEDTGMKRVLWIAGGVTLGVILTILAITLLTAGS